jgi:hypothetical protein
MVFNFNSHQLRFAHHTLPYLDTRRETLSAQRNQNFKIFTVKTVGTRDAFLFFRNFHEITGHPEKASR